MGTATYKVGDVRAVLATLPDDSVDLCLMSPPFLALRSYLDDDHPQKANEIGSESTPGEFLDALLDVVEACARVLTRTGSLVVELGDTFAGSTANGGDNEGSTRYQAGRSHVTTKRDRSQGWPQDKSLCMIPSSFAWALSYGRNPWTGRETDQWRVRNLVAWVRPNPPVGALGDKFRPASSYLTVACKARDRWFDLDAVRAGSGGNGTTGGASVEGTKGGGRREPLSGDRGGSQFETHVAGAPPLDWFNIPPQPYDGAHFACWPKRLALPFIESMCPQQVCTTCGEPRRRITENQRDGYGGRYQKKGNASRKDDGASAFETADRITVGWSDCGHDTWRNGVVLDPFAGSGTTLAVATGCGRDAIGIDLDSRNLDLARERIGMFLIEEAAA